MNTGALTKQGLSSPSFSCSFLQGSGTNVSRRRGAGGGAAELEGTIGGGGGLGKDAGARNGNGNGKKPPSTLRRLWAEAKHEKGHLAAAGVCLLASSSANLMAPAIMAK